MSIDEQQHWQNVHRTKDERSASWFQQTPAISLKLIRDSGLAPGSSVIDIGGGTSPLADALLGAGYRVTVLDISEAALSVAKERLAERASDITWIAADVRGWEPSGVYDLWHDRAAFHFLTEPQDRAAYVERLKLALRPGGTAIIATFALDGPEKCSGLPVVRYSGESLTQTLGPDFERIETRPHDHQTPSGAIQKFRFSRFRKRQTS
jgi:2-polyprenyl-3-methyl-5-hydroxy-6-metoxy-1,4-benzoquinol methylase